MIIFFIIITLFTIHVHSLRTLFERLMSYLEAASILCFLISSAISFEQLMNLKSHFHYLTNRASSGKDYSVWKTVNIFQTCIFQMPCIPTKFSNQSHDVSQFIH